MKNYSTLKWNPNATIISAGTKITFLNASKIKNHVVKLTMALLNAHSCTPVKMVILKNMKMT